MDESHKHDAHSLKESRYKRSVYDSINLKCPEEANPQKEDQWFPSFAEDRKLTG